jgi:hypothetical protein
MPENERQLRVGELTVDDVEVSPADAAGANSEEDLPWPRHGLGQLALDERPARRLEHHRAHDLSA